MKTTIKKYMWALGLLLVPVTVLAGQVLQGKVYLKNANILPDANSVGALTKAHMANRTRYVDMPISAFSIQDSGGPIPSGGADIPTMVSVNAAPAAKWAITESDKIATTFRVPSDYVSGQTFKCMFSLAAASTDTTVDFDIYKNTTAVAYDAAATNQTPVAVANSTTTMQDISLIVATDTFTANDVVTLNLWRAAGTGTGAHLYLYDCRLEYTADM